jgi:hypothetical protein
MARCIVTCDASVRGYTFLYICTMILLQNSTPWKRSHPGSDCLNTLFGTTALGETRLAFRSYKLDRMLHSDDLLLFRLLVLPVWRVLGKSRPDRVVAKEQACGLVGVSEGARSPTNLLERLAFRLGEQEVANHRIRQVGRHVDQKVLVAEMFECRRGNLGDDDIVELRG